MLSKTINFKVFPGCVAIVGSRSFNDDSGGDMKMYEEVRRFMYKLDKNIEIVSGGARGIDTYAEDAAYVRGVRTQIFLPDEKLPVPQRFHVRNTQLVQYLYKHEGVLVAFMDEKNCDGTKSTIRKAQKLGVPVLEFYYTQKGKFLVGSVPDEFVLEPVE